MIVFQRHIILSMIFYRRRFTFLAIDYNKKCHISRKLPSLESFPKMNIQSRSSLLHVYISLSVFLTFRTVTSFVVSPHVRILATTRQRSSFLSAAVRGPLRDAKSKGKKCYNPLQMKDASSSYWFTAGDRVEVLSHVTKSGIDLKGRRGQVVETWEKCDVDPTCCCAEFVDDNYAVLVKFEGPIDVQSLEANGKNVMDSFTHYFHEEELKKVKEDLGTDVIPFDGMSCTTFKLNQLKVDQQTSKENCSI